MAQVLLQLNADKSEVLWSGWWLAVLGPLLEKDESA